MSKSSAQQIREDSTKKKYFIGSTLFVLGNFIPDDPNSPDFIQFNFGYRLTAKDAFSIEIKTWKYAWPLGIPFGDSFQKEDENYPGYIRAFGIAFVYQRFLWKGAYVALHAINALQNYVDDHDKLI